MLNMTYIKHLSCQLPHMTLYVRFMILRKLLFVLKLSGTVQICTHKNNLEKLYGNTWGGGIEKLAVGGVTY